LLLLRVAELLMIVIAILVRVCMGLVVVIRIVEVCFVRVVMLLVRVKV